MAPVAPLRTAAARGGARRVHTLPEKESGLLRLIRPYLEHLKKE